jgi:LPXTG-motif cell wall-anchored protein
MRFMNRRLGASIGLMLAGVAMLAGAAAVGAQPRAQDPPGNNGTVKIDDTPFDDHPNNEPHVGCVFQVDFYGYDEGDLSADVTFTGQAPTGGGTLLTDTVAIGEDPAGGGTDLDASATYDLTEALSGITPHPQQGWHVKLTVNAEGSQGADVKHKVFWVSGCAPPPTTAPPTTAPPTTAPPTTAPPTTAPPTTAPPTTAPPTTAPPTTAPPTTAPHVGPTQPPAPPAPGAPTPTTAPPVTALPRTGTATVPMTVAGILLVLAGAAVLASQKRLQRG